MRPKTKKRAKADRKANPIEWEWLRNFDRCAICGSRFILTIHHMIGGMNRWRAKGVKAALLPACWNCNSGVLKDAVTYSLARQLYIKRMIDPGNYCLKTINRLLAPEGEKEPHQRITEQDVNNWDLKP